MLLLGLYIWQSLLNGFPHLFRNLLSLPRHARALLPFFLDGFSLRGCDLLQYPISKYAPR